jgi:hypothetical protein
MAALNDRVSRIGDFAHKRFRHSAVHKLALLTQRSRLLGECGIRTPVATWNPGNIETIAPWIEGLTGREHFTGLRAGGHLSQWKQLSVAGQAVLLGPLVQLHNVSPDGLRLQPLDPWLRITPRLSREPSLFAQGRAARIMRLYDRLQDQQALIERYHRDGEVPVHGDYHVNQIIVAKRDAMPWLLDLDDLALGFPEADLGSCMANLVTTANLLFEDVMQDYKALKSVLCPAYVSLGGRTLNAGLTDFYTAVSLLRRALKFYETGRGNPDPDDILNVCEMLALQFRKEGRSANA